METTNTLKQAYADLKAQGPIRIREAANQLGTTEAQLLATGIGEGVTPLRPEFDTILSKIEELGKVMALSRNDEVVHERKGVYSNFSTSPHAWLFVGKDIDLRIFPSSWKYAFAVQEGDDKPRYSIQFFSNDGTAIHKIYMVEKHSNFDKFNTLVEEFKADDFDANFSVQAKITNEVEEIPDEQIDAKSFQQDWQDLKDTHNFFGLLKKYKLTRTQALRLAPGEYFAKKVENLTLRNILNEASATQTSIMVFVGNPGMIQIHTGVVKNIVDHGPWINVLDPDFNLHLREDAIAESWIVRKPTEDGVVTSLELFNAKGELICTLFGERKPGIPELESWREIVAKFN